MNITVNGKSLSVPTEWQNETLLFTLREAFGLVGTKYGCGEGLCGACTILIDGEAYRSCQVTTADITSQSITTIEGVSGKSALHPVQSAWLKEQVPQCGYCQAGQIMSAIALLQTNPTPDDEAIDAAMEGNLCRCGTYDRIRKAIKSVAGGIK